MYREFVCPITTAAVFVSLHPDEHIYDAAGIYVVIIIITTWYVRIRLKYYTKTQARSHILSN